MALLKVAFAKDEPLPFYENTNDQTRNDPECGHCCPSLISGIDSLPPFQINNNNILGATVTDWRILPVGLGVTFVLKLSDIDNVFCPLDTIHSYDGHPITDQLNNPISCGLYYYQVTLSTGEVLFSETFQATDLKTTTGYKLKYRHSCDFNDFCFTVAPLDIFKFEYFIDSPIKAPEVEFFEDGKEDGFGNFTASFKKLTKRLAFDLAQLTDAQICALSTMALMDSIELEIIESGAVVKTITLNDVLFTVTPSDSCYSFGEISFRATPHTITTLCC